MGESKPLAQQNVFVFLPYQHFLLPQRHLYHLKFEFLQLDYEFLRVTTAVEMYFQYQQFVAAIYYVLI